MLSESVTFLNGESLGQGSGTGPHSRPFGTSPLAESDEFVFAEARAADAGLLVRAMKQDGDISPFEQVLENPGRALRWFVAHGSNVYVVANYEGSWELRSSNDQGDSFQSEPLPAGLQSCSGGSTPQRITEGWATLCDGQLLVSSEDLSTWRPIDLSLDLRSLTGDGSAAGPNTVLRQLASDGERLIGVVETDFEGASPIEKQLMLIDPQTGSRTGDAEWLLAGDEVFDFAVNIVRLYPDGKFFVGMRAGGNGGVAAEQRWVAGQLT